ncbi:MAG: preprotein translocase subunit SecG [Bacteroidia bacterium]|jgi:preprotein translocase subunit SecG|nr:preprotein translocase subunit SecG [Bacteroidia bacterium]
MEIILELLTLIVCVLLILIVLVQDSKGGGLSSSFGASNQILGVRKTTDFLEKATWVMAISLLVLCLASASLIHTTSSAGGESSITQQQAQNMAVPQQAPMQQQAPQQQQGQPGQQAQPQGNNAAPQAAPPANKPK